ncbi:hypothetical protein Tco_0359313 [Tanacetum coccineum]
MITVGTRAVVSKGKVENVLKKDKWGNPEILLQDHVVVDSGCSSHMTGNKAYLSDFEDLNEGFVAFRNELKFNLFSVSQMCDKKNSVLFTESECLILSPSFKLLDESQVVLRAPRKDGVYSLDLKNIVPSGGFTYPSIETSTDESRIVKGLIICGDMIQRKLGSFVSFREMITSQLQGKLWLYDEVRMRLCLFCHHQIGEDCWDS